MPSLPSSTMSIHNRLLAHRHSAGSLMGSSVSSPIVYVYQDAGVGPTSFAHTMATLQDVGCMARPLTAQELIDGQWQENAYALVMPGGADIPYHAALKGGGNQVISRYVQSGGRYIGICAGAYYAAQHIVFHHANGEFLSQERELGFFPGTIHGPFWGPYDPYHQLGARAIAIRSVDHPERLWHTYIHGGGQFCPSFERMASADKELQPTVRPLWIDQRGHWVAVVCHVGLGRAVLSACHWEWMPHRPIAAQHPGSSQAMPATEYALWSADPDALMAAACAMVYEASDRAKTLIQKSHQ